MAKTVENFGIRCANIWRYLSSVIKFDLICLRHDFKQSKECSAFSFWNSFFVQAKAWKSFMKAFSILVRCIAISTHKSIQLSTEADSVLSSWTINGHKHLKTMTFDSKHSHFTQLSAKQVFFAQKQLDCYETFETAYFNWYASLFTSLTMSNYTRKMLKC